MNRAMVVMCVSAWEAYVEELVKESIEILRPATGPVGTWSSLKAAALSQVGRFHNPDVENVQSLLSDFLGVPDITASWFWRNCPQRRAVERLKEAIKCRHDIAHGVNPRPRVSNAYAGKLPGFFTMLGKCTDKAVRQHLVFELGVQNPWAS